MTTLTVPGLLLDGAWIPPIRVYGGATKSLVDIVCSELDSIFPGFLASRFDLSFAQELEDPLNVDLVLDFKGLRCLVPCTRSAEQRRGPGLIDCESTDHEYASLWWSRGSLP